jgi:hypothetical protein
MLTGIEAGFLLDRQWRAMRGEADTTKKPTLLLLARLLAATRTQYAVIGGVALQAHRREPRTTLDIEVALAASADLPRADLEGAGFRRSGTHQHSENWLSPDGTPVQFSDDPEFATTVKAAEEHPFEDTVLRIARRMDLVHAKLRAAGDPERRRSKRLQDLVDAQTLLEEDPALAADLSPVERALLATLPR